MAKLLLEGSNFLCGSRIVRLPLGKGHKQPIRIEEFRQHIGKYPLHFFELFIEIFQDPLHKLIEWQTALFGEPASLGKIRCQPRRYHLMCRALEIELHRSLFLVQQFADTFFIGILTLHEDFLQQRKQLWHFLFEHLRLDAESRSAGVRFPIFRIGHDIVGNAARVQILEISQFRIRMLLRIDTANKFAEQKGIRKLFLRNG